MRIVLMIILLGLGGSTKAQTYFNMRYHESGQWGGGTRSLVYKNSELYFNSLHVVDVVDFIEQTFFTVNIANGHQTFGVTIKMDSADVHSGSLIGYSNGGFYDVLSIDAPNESKRFRYGVVKYTNTGDSVFLNITVDSSLFLSVYDVVESPDKKIVFTGITQTIPANQSGTEDIILIKTGSLGNEIWRKTYGSLSTKDRGTSLAVAPDGGYIIGGVRGVVGTFDP